MKTSLTIKSLLITSTLVSSIAYAQPKISFKELKKRVTKKQYQEEKLDNLNVLTSRYASWGVLPANKTSSVNLLEAWKKFEGRKEIVVAVIDTGIDPNHPFLKDNLAVVQTKKFHPKKRNMPHKKFREATKYNYGVDFSKGRKFATQPIDSHGHGTHVSGIIKSVFPKVKILPLKYYNQGASGKDNLDSTIQALKYAVDQNVDIINYSGGGPEPDLEELAILKRAEEKGILVVAAAGNEESNIDKKENAYFPASYKLSNIITVTAHDKSLQILSSSNFGKNSVDISAPGYRIKSALNGGARSGFLTGTSQATAFVSGAAALLMAQFPDLNVKQVRKIISLSAKKSFTFLGKCKSEGRLDVSKAQELAAKVSRMNKDKTNFASTGKNKKRKVATENKGKIIYRLAN